MVRIALAGLGNASSALVQAVEMAKRGRQIIGSNFSPSEIASIEIVEAFDIDRRKVGKPLSEAIFSPPNVVDKYVEVSNNVIVKRAPTMDGRTGLLEEILEESEEIPVNVEDSLKENRVEVLLILLPTGADQASSFYTQAALSAGVNVINGSPSPLAKRYFRDFLAKGNYIVGDDLMSQAGGTAIHAGVIEMLKSRGIKVKRSYQVDIAGTTEAFVTLEDSKKDLKKGIKTNYLATGNNGMEIVAGTSDYVSFLRDRRVSYMVIEGEYSFGVPIRIDLSLKTLDGPNAVVPLIDTILSLRRVAGEYNRDSEKIKEICRRYFKSPP